ncbi:MAG TPA: hypothetical protein VIF15_00145 [Polyangiaceae bacterium]|jgi:hypothetical protein
MDARPGSLLGHLAHLAHLAHRAHRAPAPPVLLVLVLSSACGSSSSGTPADQPCALSMPVSGGMSATLSGSSCGESGESVLFWTGAQLDGPFVDVGFATPIAGGQTGTLVVQQLRITANGADGGAQGWQTPANACTLDVTSSTSSPDATFKNRYILVGSGTCTQPAAPDPGNPGAPITIGDFTFHAFIDPP